MTASGPSRRFGLVWPMSALPSEIDQTGDPPRRSKRADRDISTERRPIGGVYIGLDAIGPPSCRMRCQMCEQQGSDPVRRLVGSKMAYARQLYEFIGRSHKLLRSLRCHSADSIVGVTPDE
jgi:hypothetical protein